MAMNTLIELARVIAWPCVGIAIIICFYKLQVKYYRLENDVLYPDEEEVYDD